LTTKSFRVLRQLALQWKIEWRFSATKAVDGLAPAYAIGARRSRENAPENHRSRAANSSVRDHGRLQLLRIAQAILLPLSCALHEAVRELARAPSHLAL
jgi:hypothetical protein